MNDLSLIGVNLELPFSTPNMELSKSTCLGDDFKK